MKIEIVKSELPQFEVDGICEIVNEELNGNKWHIRIYDNFPEFVYDLEDDWEISWDKYELAWILTYDGKCVGQVRFEDDMDILWDRKV